MAEYVYNQTLDGKMVGNTKVFGLPLESETPEYNVGDLLIDSTTGAVYQYIQCWPTAPIGPGDVVSVLPGTTGLVCQTTPATAAGVAAVVGVSPYEIKANYYGFITRSGNAIVKVTGAPVVGTILVPDVAVSGNAIALAPGAAYAQAEAVAALNRMGTTVVAAAAGVATVNLKGCW